MLEELREQVLAANLLLPKYGLVTFTWGNVSGIDHKSGLVVIKPSGVEYDFMTAQDMVVVDLEGNVVEGTLRPSSDLMTHLELYQRFSGIGGVVHTHSRYATAFAQAERAIPCFGTTHADYFYGSVPCTRHLTSEEIQADYELNTGRVIAETFETQSLDPAAVPGVNVCKHGPFTWGKTPAKAVESAAVLDEVARLAILTLQIQADAPAAPQALQDKHYLRKHGPNAYYGQKEPS